MAELATPDTAWTRPSDVARVRHMNARSQSWVGSWFAIYVTLWLLDGVLRKWVAPGLSDPIYLARDLITVVVFFVVLLSGVPRATAQRMGVAGMALLVFLALAMVQVITTKQPLPSLAVGVMTYGSPLLALSMVTVIEDRKRHLRRAETLILSVLPVEALLAILQTLSPDGSFWNRTGDQGVVGLMTSGDVVRATGTFVSPSALTAYVLVAVALIMSRLMREGIRLSLGLAILTVSCVILVALGGSRSAVLGAGYVLLGAGVWTLYGSGSGFKRVTRLIASALTIYVAFRLSVHLFPNVTGAFATRFNQAAQSESASGRILSNAFGYLGQLDDIRWWGDGLGSHSLVGIALGSPQQWIEGELPRWVEELGIVGVVLCLVRQVAGVLLIVAAWRNARAASVPYVALLSLTLAPALIYGVVTAPASQAGFAITAASLIWLGWSRQSEGAVEPVSSDALHTRR